MQPITVFTIKKALPDDWFSHRVDAGYAFMNLPDRMQWQRTMILSRKWLIQAVFSNCPADDDSVG